MWLAIFHIYICYICYNTFYYFWVLFMQRTSILQPYSQLAMYMYMVHIACYVDSYYIAVFLNQAGSYLVLEIVLSMKPLCVSIVCVSVCVSLSLSSSELLRTHHVKQSCVHTPIKQREVIKPGLDSGLDWTNSKSRYMYM